MYSILRCFTCLALFLSSFIEAFAKSAAPSFSRDIRPILSGNCFKCHGPDPEAREAEFRLDRRQSAIDADVIVPGNPAESWILDMVSSDDPDMRMPPKGDPLSEEEIDKLRAWIENGAEYQAHWAYQKPDLAEQPNVRRRSWPTSELDYFVLDRMEEAKLKPESKAKSAVLLRRLYLDLIGIPPTVEDVTAFEDDPSPKNFEAHVDRLLRSPGFGEKWAASWLDLARYADSNGYQHDDMRTMWPYRDWVINALNDGMPFDQFSIEQLAGDLLPNPTKSQLIATGFNRNVPTNFSGGTKVPEVRANILHDRVSTTGAVWLGLTLECAQCHDHKFDDISQKEYYQLYAFYNKSIQEVDQDGDGMFRKLFTGREVTVYPSDAVRQLAQQLKHDIAVEEEIIAELDEFPKGDTPEAVSEKVVLLDFEGSDPLKSSSSTRPTINSLADNVPIGGGNFAVSVRAEPVLETKGIFGAGFSFPTTDLSGITEITFWIKTDIRSEFNFQVQKNWDRRVSIFGFSNFHLEPETWTKIVAPLAEFTVPQWSIGPVDWTSVQKIQITAYGEESYDGKYIMVDNVVGATSSEQALREKRVAQLRVQLTEMQSSTMVMQDAMEPTQTHIMMRGDYTAPGDSVGTGVLESLHPLDPELPPNRLGLAQWLVDPENPLTPRVVVNRIWAEIFGRGIVTTPEDFGMQGELPTHPELLDWLAISFVENNWSIKELIKTIVLSSTYQQSSSASAVKIMKDPQNNYYSRGPRFRLSAELIRDSLLAISGLLSDKVGGPIVYPVQPDGIWKEIFGPVDETDYPTSSGEDLYRRGIYTVWRRGNPYPSMVNFDTPDRNVCTVKRDRSNTPLQALTLLNDPVYVEMAERFAKVIEGWDGSDRDKIVRSFRTVVSRQPSRRELNILMQLLEQQQSWFAVAQTLLNLDETITKS